MDHTIAMNHVKDTIFAGILERKRQEVIAFNIQLIRRPTPEEEQDLLEAVQEFFNHARGLL